ncbi:MAG: RNA polymerase sigma-70 factor (ECF subfamily), partial [Pseudohongiellaceae bacterium]
RLRQGDDAAFERLVRQQGGRMLAVARRFMRSEDLAEDAVQDAFLQAFKNIDRFEGGSLISTWLHRIVVNACLMRLRKASRSKEVSIEDLLPKYDADSHHLEPAGEWAHTGEAAAELKEQQALVRASIDKLPESYRNVLLLRDIEQLNTADTAELMDLSINATKIRLHRARQALRQILDPHMRVIA